MRRLRRVSLVTVDSGGRCKQSRDIATKMNQCSQTSWAQFGPYEANLKLPGTFRARILTKFWFLSIVLNPNLSLFVPTVGTILGRIVSLNLCLGPLGAVLESTWSYLGLCYASWAQFGPYDPNLKPPVTLRTLIST